MSYKVEEFEKDISDTNGIIDFIKDCNDSWKRIAGEYIDLVDGVLKPRIQVLSAESKTEILMPYIKDFLDLLEMYELDWWRLCSVEAVNISGSEQLIWEFINDVKDVVYVFIVNDRCKTSRISPVVTGDINKSVLIPENERWVVKA